MNLGAWGRPSADPGAVSVLQDVRRAEPAGRWGGGWLGGRPAQQRAEAVLARGLQARDARVAPVQPLIPTPACLAQNAATPRPTSGGTCKRNKKRKQAVLLGKVEFSIKRGTVANWQSLSTNGISLWIRTAHGSQGKPQFIYDQMQHLVEVFIYSKHFFGKIGRCWRQTSEKKKCEEETLMENSRSTSLMSERRRKNENLFCHGLWGPGRSFIGLWRIDTVCVSEAKGDWISIGTLLEGMLEFFYYGGLNESVQFLGCC